MAGERFNGIKKCPAIPLARAIGVMIVSLAHAGDAVLVS